MRYRVVEVKNNVTTANIVVRFNGQSPTVTLNADGEWHTIILDLGTFAGTATNGRVELTGDHWFLNYTDANLVKYEVDYEAFADSLDRFPADFECECPTMALETSSVGAEGHAAVCKICGTSYDVTAHTPDAKYGVKVGDSYFKTCSVCNDVTDTPAYGNVTIDAAAIASSAKSAVSIVNNGEYATITKNDGDSWFLFFTGNTTRETGQYVLIKYRNVDFTEIGTYSASVELTGPTGKEHVKLTGFVQDTDTWHYLIVDMSAKSGYWKAENDVYSANYFRLNWSGEGDIAYIAFANDIEYFRSLVYASCDHRSASTDHNADYTATCIECGQVYQKYVDTLWDKYLFAKDMGWSTELTKDGAKFVGTIKGNTGDHSVLGTGNVISILEDHPGVPNSEYFFVKYKVGEGTTMEIAEQSVGGDWYWMSEVATIVADAEWHVLVYQCTTDKAGTFKIYFNTDSADVDPVVEIAYAGFAHTKEQIDAFLEAKGDTELVEKEPEVEDLENPELPATDPYVTADYVTVAPGEEFTITVRIGNNPGLWSFAFELPIDTEVFEFVKANISTSIFDSQGACGYDKAVSTYVYNMYYSDTFGDITDDGTLAVITLRVKEDVAVGNYTLDIQPVTENCINSFYEEIEFADVDCVVMVRNAE